MKLFKRLYLSLLSFGLMALAIYSVEPPSTWQNATYIQLAAFFIPLILLLLSFFNLFLNNFLRSGVLTTGAFAILILSIFNQLNMTFAVIVVILVLIFMFIFPKILHKLHLTRSENIPKLPLSSVRKAEKSPLRRL